MRTLALTAALLSLVLSGCSGGKAGTEVVGDALSFTVAGTEATVGVCGGRSHETIGILTVTVRNAGMTTLTGPDYDFVAYDWEGLDYPFCPVDEPMIAPGASANVELRFFQPTQQQEPCVGLKSLELRFLQDGAWRTTIRQASGFADPCP